MQNITYSRLPEIDSMMSSFLTSNGIIDINSSYFLRQLVELIKDSTKGPYNQIYEIAKNTDIGRSSGEWLDRWGRFLNQPRTAISYASDLSLNNTEIFIYPEENAAELTNDGQGIIIPEGTIISNSDGDLSVRTIDQVQIEYNKSSVFVRVISEVEGNVVIPSGELERVTYKLNEVNNILPGVVSKYSLRARNSKEISGGEVYAEDKIYSFILQEAANSIGLSNERKINMLLDIADIYDIKIQKYRGGLCVYIDCIDISLIDSIVLLAKNYIKYDMNMGMPVSCFGPIIRTFKPRIALSLKDQDSLGVTHIEFKEILASSLMQTKMGDSINMKDMINDSIVDIPNIISASVVGGTLNGRELLNDTISLNFNERIKTSTLDITLVQ